MKVLERKEWSLERTCPTCQSRLLIEPSDVRAGKFGSMGDCDYLYYAKCEVCGDNLMFGSFPSFPQSVLEAADKRYAEKQR